MKIRSYRSDDCPHLAELFWDTVHNVNARDYTPAQLAAWATGTVDLAAWDASFRVHRTLVAEEDGHIIGFGDMDASGYLDRLYVHKDHQGRGAATAICDALERDVPAAVYTTHASISARPFFEDRGYRVVREQQVQRHGVKLTNFVMEKKALSGFCDLHTHSVFSDGTDTPTELVRAAKELGLGAIALTDHNTIAGLPEFLRAAAQQGIEAVPGVEFSAEFEGLDVHILGLFIGTEDYRKVSDLLEEGCRQKEQSNLTLVNALRAEGYDLDYSSIKARSPKGQINRAHIAAALTEKGYTSSIKEAFDTLLSPERGFYRPPRRPGAFEIIRFVKSLGAAAVLAHPLLTMDEQTLRRFLKPARQSGLDAMETIYSTYDAETAALAVKIAAEFGLLQSGGSDFHGHRKPDTMLGRGRGALRVPLGIYEELKSKKKCSPG